MSGSIAGIVFTCACGAVVFSGVILALYAGTYASLLDMEPAVDGIFRAVPHGVGSQPGGVSAGKNGRWVVTLNLAGECHVLNCSWSPKDRLGVELG